MPEYKAGDVILVRGGGIAGFLVTLGDWWERFWAKNPQEWATITHTGIMVDSTNIVEALSNGVIKRSFPYTKNFYVYRKKDLSEENAQLISHTALSFVGQHYSWFLIAVIAVAKILRIERLIKSVGYVGKICSVIVAKCYKLAKYFFGDESTDLIDPGDIAYYIMEVDKDKWVRVS